MIPALDTTYYVQVKSKEYLLPEEQYMKKNLKILCMVFAIICLFTGCASTKLAEGYDKKVIKETAEQVINEVQLKGTKTVLQERMREDFLANIDLDVMDDTVKNLISGLGEFVTYSQETIIGKQYEDTGEDFAVILVTATYKKGEANYTITFDKDMNIVGFYAK